MRALSLVLLLVPSTAWATSIDEPRKPRRELAPLAEPEPEPEPDHKWVTLAWQPLQALIPIWSFSIEARVAERIGVAAFGGFGNAPIYVGGDPARKERRSATQIGGLATYYVSGSFDDGGVHAGVAAQWTRVTGDGDLATSAVRPGLLVGPLLGFKWVLRGGFTVDSQIGVGFLAAEGSGARANDPDQKAALIGSLGVGWTF